MSPLKFKGVSHEMWPTILGQFTDLQARNPSGDPEMLFQAAKDIVWAEAQADTQLFMYQIGLKGDAEEPIPEDF